MRAPFSDRVVDENTRLTHAELNRLINLLPPSMFTAMGFGTLLIIVQSWLHNFSWQSLSVLGWHFSGAALISSMIGRRIRAVKGFSSDGDIRQIREGLGKLAQVHQIGLIVTAGVVVLQGLFKYIN